jgi:hypothetical protein
MTFTTTKTTRIKFWMLLPIQTIIIIVLARRVVKHVEGIRNSVGKYGYNAIAVLPADDSKR